MSLTMAGKKLIVILIILSVPLSSVVTFYTDRGEVKWSKNNVILLFEWRER